MNTTEAIEQQAEPERMTLLTCGCCGSVFYGEHDPAHDRGFGTCDPCKLWIVENFYTTRIKLLAEALKPKNAEKLRNMTREQQENIVDRAYEKGIFKW